MTFELGFIERAYLRETFGLSDEQITSAVAELGDGEKVTAAIKTAWPHIQALMADVAPVLPNASRLLPVILSALHTINQKKEA